MSNTGSWDDDPATLDAVERILCHLVTMRTVETPPLADDLERVAGRAGPEVARRLLALAASIRKAERAVAADLAMGKAAAD